MKDILIRAAKTAVQATLGLVTAEILLAGDISAIETAVSAGAAAGLSVLMNAVLQWSSS